jgi:hypothetical protein
VRTANALSGNALSQVAEHWRQTRAAANQAARLDETLSGKPKS